MSFGVSLGDFVAVSTLAWRVYKSCKDAPRAFQHVSSDVLSLHAVLIEVREVLDVQSLSFGQQQRLWTVWEGCQRVLSDLQSVVHKYESLGARNKRIRDRIEWDPQEISDLRSRLTVNMVLLSTFVSVSKIQAGKNQEEGKDESSSSAILLQAVDPEETRIWRQICNEMQEAGITAGSFGTHKESIIKWLRHDPLVEAIGEEDDDLLVLADETSPRPMNRTPTFEPVIGDPWMKVEELTVNIGNTHREVIIPELPRNSECRNGWTFFVRPSRTDIIQEVRIFLHPTFQPPSISCAHPPYQVSRIGWGFFDIRAAIMLKPGHYWKTDEDPIYIVDDPKRRVLLLEWTLDFDSPRTTESRAFLVET